jgi:RimJ/RimL family protein N-acetyltransferase
MFVRSERLFLRPGWPEDWRELLDLVDEAIVRNLAKTPWPYTADDARRFTASTQDKRLPHFLVTLPGAHGPRLIGACGLDRIGDDVELGFWIARDHWGRGYAAEAGRAVLGLARALGHERIVSSHFQDNPASGKVLGKIGFVPTGRVCPRFSRGRGQAAPAVEFAVVLDREGNTDDDPQAGMNHAA